MLDAASLLKNRYRMEFEMTMKTEKKVYEIANKKPVARFYYKGTHTHPVRRTVVLIEETETTITGYELRCGKDTRTINDALSEIKTYRKDRIAKWGDYSRLRQSSKTSMKNPNRTTLERFPIVSMFNDGV